MRRFFIIECLYSGTMTEVLKDGDGIEESEDLESLRDLEKLKDLVDEKEKKSGKQSNWKGTA